MRSAFSDVRLALMRRSRIVGSLAMPINQPVGSFKRSNVAQACLPSYKSLRYRPSRHYDRSRKLFYGCEAGV